MNILIVLLTILLAALSYQVILVLVDTYNLGAFVFKYKIKKQEYIPCAEMKDILASENKKAKGTSK